MATLCAIQSGNWTASSTWGVADSTSLLLTANSASNVGTTATNSASFTPGAITVSGFYLSVSGRVVANPTGTLTFSIAQGGTPVAGTSVTVNATDFPASTLAAQHTWMYFKFTTPVTLLAATAYTIRAIGSVNAQIAMSTNGTANNWSRALVTTTTAAPASTDTMLISGEHTAAATFSTYTVSYDNTTTTTWGTVANTALQIGVRGIMDCPSAASTAYYLRAGGNIIIGSLGEWKIASSGSRLPSTSTFTVEMNVASAAQFEIFRRALGVVNLYGAEKTHYVLLGANAAASATSMTLATAPSGWLANDNIVFAPTSNSTIAFDQRVINTISGTALTITVGLTNAKTLISGTYRGVECEVINLTRNIRIIGVNGNFISRYTETGVGTTIFDGVELRHITNTLSGVSGNVSTWTNSSTWDLSTSWAIYSNFNIAGFQALRCVYFNMSAISVFGAQGLTDENDYSFDDIVGLRSTNGSQGLFGVSTGGFKLINSRLISGANSIITFGNNSIYTKPVYINNSKFKVSNGGLVLTLGTINQEISSFVVENSSFYLTSGAGVNITSSHGIILRNINCYSNTGSQIQFGAASNCFVTNSFFNAGTTSLGTQGLSISSICSNIFLRNCAFANDTTFSTSDIRSNVSIRFDAFVDLQNCTFGSSSLMTLQNTLGEGSEIRISRQGQTDKIHRIIKKQGNITSDQTIYDTTTPGTISTRLTPIASNQKLRTSLKSVVAKDGSFVTVSVKVRCSVISDGATYNGARPRLMLLTNTATHVQTSESNTVLATATVAANGAFETISGTIPTALIDDAGISVYVDCDGTSGFINVDSWRFS